MINMNKPSTAKRVVLSTTRHVLVDGVGPGTGRHPDRYAEHVRSTVTVQTWRPLTKSRDRIMSGRPTFSFSEQRLARVTGDRCGILHRLAQDCWARRHSLDVTTASSHQHSWR